MTLARGGLSVRSGISAAVTAVAGKRGSSWICYRCASSLGSRQKRRAVMNSPSSSSAAAPVVSLVSGQTLYVQRALSPESRSRTWNLQHGIRFQERTSPVTASTGTMSGDEGPSNSDGGGTSSYAARDMGTQTELSLQSVLSCPNCHIVPSRSAVPTERREYSTRAAAVASDEATQSTTEDVENSTSQPYSQDDPSYVPSDDDFPMSREELLAYAKLPLRESKVTDDEMLSLADSMESLIVESQTTAADEKHIPFEFQMSEDVLKAAQNAEQNTRESFWSHKFYRGKDGQAVKIHYCDTRDHADEVAKLFADEEAIGFDLEWKVWDVQAGSVRDNISLIQLASESQIALFHVAKFGVTFDDRDFDMPNFKALMESRSVSKCGVNIMGDANRLSQYMQIKSQGLFELSHLHRLVECCRLGNGLPGKRLVSLANQVREHLLLPLDKTRDVRCGDWSQALNQTQIEYAADDAYAGVQLFNVLEGKRKALDPIPPRPAFAELLLPIAVARPKPKKGAGRKNPKTSTSSSSGDESSDFLSPSPIPATGFADPCSKGQSHPAKLTSAQNWVTSRQHLPPMLRPFKVGPSLLRAYALWHLEGLSIPDVAATLRTPPLLQNTVSCYIVEAIRTEKLSYDKHRMVDEIFTVLPDYAVNYRFKTFIEDLEKEMNGGKEPKKKQEAVFDAELWSREEELDVSELKI